MWQFLSGVQEKTTSYTVQAEGELRIATTPHLKMKPNEVLYHVDNFNKRADQDKLIECWTVPDDSIYKTELSLRDYGK